MTTRLVDRVFLAAFILAGVIYLFQSFELAASFAGSGFGPGHFPIILGGLLIVLCLAQMGVSCFGRQEQADSKVEFLNAGKLAFTVGLTAIFFVAWAMTGRFYISAAAFFFALVASYAPERNLRTMTVAAVAALLFAAFLFVVFDVALGVSLV
jgi:hypothetical protein